VGNILLNNIDEKVLRDNLSYVLQESYIYSDTVSNNIFLGNYDNEDKLNYVTDICQLNDLVKDLPKGYIIHNNGANLSGGQKQKIGLARSIIRQPQISDEIYNRHRTIIFVTHNFEILNKADLVIYLGKNGNYYINSHYKLLSECEDYNNYIKIN
jgi:ABC-type bacteriocin/lantibiotic exporter with double-glycine peptidase domain